MRRLTPSSCCGLFARRTRFRIVISFSKSPARFSHRWKRRRSRCICSCFRKPLWLNNLREPVSRQPTIRPTLATSQHGNIREHCRQSSLLTCTILAAVGLRLRPAAVGSRSPLARGLTHAREASAPETVDSHVTEDQDGVRGSDHLLPVPEDRVVHLVSRPEGSAEGFDGFGVTQVEVRPDPCPGMVVPVQPPGSHPPRDTQHAGHLASVEVRCWRALQLFPELGFVEFLEGQCIHRR